MINYNITIAELLKKLDPSDPLQEAISKKINELDLAEYTRKWYNYWKEALAATQQSTVSVVVISKVKFFAEFPSEHFQTKEEWLNNTCKYFFDKGLPVEFTKLNVMLTIEQGIVTKCSKAIKQPSTSLVTFIDRFASLYNMQTLSCRKLPGVMYISIKDIKVDEVKQVLYFISMLDYALSLLINDSKLK